MLDHTRESQICSGEQPMEFFHNVVNAAVESLHVRTNDVVIFYIVNLLSEFVKIDKLYGDLDLNADEEPLTLLFEKALNSDQNEQIKQFKHLGDVTLFVTGFFSDSLYRRLVNLDFYINVGCTSYNQLANIMKNKAQGKTFCELYSELSENFTVFVNVLSEVSEKSFSHSNLNILRVYERWLKTRSLRDENILRNEGVIPKTAGEGKYIH